MTHARHQNVIAVHVAMRATISRGQRNGGQILMQQFQRKRALPSLRARRSEMAMIHAVKSDGSSREAGWLR